MNAADALRDLPTLGVGLGYREPFRADLFLHRDRVDFLEVTADHFFDASAAKLRELDLLADHFPLIPHGLDLSLGGAEGLDPAYLDRLAGLVHRLDPPWWSEHVAFTHSGGVALGHLAPVPFDEEALDVLAANIATALARIPTPLIVENITSPFVLPGATMDEAAFLRALCDRTGCGLLLDVANLHANSRNHGYDPIAFLDALPLDRVVQLHFAGGHVGRDGRVVDSHAMPTAPEVWDLLDAVVARAPVRGIILERDENLPPFGQLLDELDRARAIGRAHGRWR